VRITFCLFFLGLIFPAWIVAAEPAPAESVHEYDLKNGLKLIVKEDHRAPVVFSSIWYKVGGSYEPRGITGISHALEHMMFRGTEKYGPGKLAEIVNQNGGDQNAMTSDDYTVYFQTFSADKLAISFELEADRMQHLLLDPDAFSKEIQVVMEERRMRTDDDPQSLASERINAIAFINNPYSRPVVGWMSDLLQMRIDDLKNWYHTWYAPNNAVVVVVGDVVPEQVLALANQYYGPIPSGNIPVLKNTQEVSALGVRRLEVRIPAQLRWMYLTFNTPSLSTVTAENSNDPYALAVLAYVLGGGESTRLAHDLVRGKQILASASADYDRYNLHENLLSLSATPSQQAKLTDVESALREEITRLQKQLVSADELKRAKALLIANHEFEQDSLMNQAFNLGLPEVTHLSWQVENDFVSHIRAVTPEQIQAVANRYLIPEKLTIGILNPIIAGASSAKTGVSHADNSAIH
jgi:zinc protease